MTSFTWSKSERWLALGFLGMALVGSLFKQPRFIAVAVVMVALALVAPVLMRQLERRACNVVVEHFLRGLLTSTFYTAVQVLLVISLRPDLLPQ